MTPYLIEALVACCILLSLGMVLIFAFALGLLLKLHKITKHIHRITSLFQFEARWLPPLFIGKKMDSELATQEIQTATLLSASRRTHQ